MKKFKSLGDKLGQVSLIWLYNEFQKKTQLVAVLPGIIRYDSPEPFQKIINDYFGVGKEITGPCELELYEGKWVYFMPNGHGQDYEFSFFVEVATIGETLREF